MHPVIQRHFDGLFRRFPPGTEMLEIGASAKSAAGFTRALPGCSYTGLNMEATRTDSGPGWRIVEGNGNDMSFGDSSFDAVLCNAVLEHDQRFWLTVAEAHRVLRPGGLFYVGVPGFSSRVGRLARFALRVQRRLPAGHRVTSWPAFGRLIASPTYPFHAAPDDYYRFSPDAVRRVLLDGFDVLDVAEVFRPPRVIAVGRKR